MPVPVINNAADGVTYEVLGGSWSWRLNDGMLPWEWSDSWRSPGWSTPTSSTPPRWGPPPRRPPPPCGTPLPHGARLPCRPCSDPTGGPRWYCSGATYSASYPNRPSSRGRLNVQEARSVTCRPYSCKAAAPSPVCCCICSPYWWNKVGQYPAQHVKYKLRNARLTL